MARLKLDPSAVVSFDDERRPDPNAAMYGAAPAVPPGRQKLDDAAEVKYDDESDDDIDRMIHGPSKLESFGRGALQGATFGFADEVIGGLGSLVSDDDYKTIRDRWRQGDKEAQDANPWSYGIGEVGAGIATGLATGGAGIARAGAKVGLTTAARLGAATGALEGAVSGLGHSEAEDIGGIAKDAATSAAVGGAIGGVAGKLTDKFLAGAPKRALGDLQEDVVEGARGVTSRLKYKQQLANVADEKAVNYGSEVAARMAKEADETNLVDVIAKHPDLEKALGKTEKAREIIKRKLDDLRDVNPKEYKVLDDAAGGGVRVGTIRDRLASELDALNESPTNSLLKAELRNRLDDVVEAWATRPKADDLRRLVVDVVDGEVDEAAVKAKGLGNALEKLRAEQAAGRLTKDVAEEVSSSKEAADELIGRLKLDGKAFDPERRIPLAEVRRWVSDVQNKASTTLGSIDQTTRAPVMSEMAGLAKGILDDEIVGIVEKNPALEAAGKKILETNREMAILLAMDRNLENRALKEAAKGKGLGQRLKDTVNMGGAMATIPAAMAGNPVPLATQAALNVALPAGKAALKKANVAAAKLIRAAQKGDVSAAAKLAAVRAGVPAATANAIINRFASKQTPKDDLEAALAANEEGNQ